MSFRGEDLVSETLGRRYRTKAQTLVRDVLLFTVAIEAAGAAILTALFFRSHGFWEAMYQGVFHSVSAFCNAGFALYQTSFIGYRGDWLLNVTVMLLIVLGGIGFIVLDEFVDHWRAWHSGRKVRLSLHAKVVLTSTVLLILAGALGILAFEGQNALRGLGWQETVLASLFQSVTARTAGFNTLDYATLTNTTLFMTVLLMFTGGSPGSCAGGIKTTTLFVIVALFRDRLLARKRVHLFRRTLPEATVARSVALLIASFAFVTAATFILLATEIGPVPHRQGGGTFLEYFFETVSAFGTVGLSTGVTAGLSTLGKLLITVVMFVGRLGPLTLAFAVGVKEDRGAYRYAEETLVVG